MHSTPPNLEVLQSLAEIAYRKLSASPVVDPAGRWRSNHETERAIRRVSAREFDAAEPRAAERVAEKHLCESPASAGADAECKN
jgi:hypothetical protein